MPPRSSNQQENANNNNNQKPTTAKSNKRNELNDQRQRIDLTKLKNDTTLQSDAALKQMEDPLAKFLTRPGASAAEIASSTPSSSQS